MSHKLRKAGVENSWSRGSRNTVQNIVQTLFGWGHPFGLPPTRGISSLSVGLSDLYLCVTGELDKKAVSRTVTYLQEWESPRISEQYPKKHKSHTRRRYPCSLSHIRIYQ